MEQQTPSWGITPVPERLRVLGLFDLTLLWGNLSVSLLSLGELDRAERELALALEFFTETQEQEGTGQATVNVGIADRLRGRLQQAVARHSEALELAVRTESASLEALAANELGTDLRLLGLL